MSEMTAAHLGDIAKIERAGVAPADIESGTLYVGLEHIESGGRLLDIKPVENGDLASTKFAFTPKHVLYGKLRPYLAKIAVPNFSGVCSTDILPILPGPKLDRSYLTHFLRQQRMVDYATARSSGANLPRLSPKSLAEFEIPLPPLDEQRRIAAILDKADSLRQKRKQAIALLDSLTQSIFLEMFGDPIANPHSFPIRAMEEIVAPDRRVTYGILKPGPDIEAGVPYIRVVDIQGGNVLSGQLRRTSVDISEQYKRSRLRAGDLLISIRGHVGRMAIVPDECDGANITQDTARLAIEGANAEFVMALLATGGAQHWMAQRTKGIAVRGINLGDLKQFPVIMPNAALQSDFARKSRSVRSLIAAAQSHLALAEDSFQSMQYRAFAGEV